MPPKIKVTADDVIKAAVEIVRESGDAALNARALAERIGCSTQPIFSNFRNMDEVRATVIAEADWISREYIDREIRKKEYPPYKASGMAYILFAGEEKELFKLLYMRDRSRESVSEDTELNRTMTDMVAEGTGLAGDRSRLFHLEMWAFVHGIAAMSATGFLDLPRELISDMLTDCYNGLKLRFGGEK